MESIPDHKIEAFVDNELDRSDRDHLLNAMLRSSQVSARVAETRRLKDLVKLAYQDEHPAATDYPARTKKYRGHAVAAIFGALSMLLLMQLLEMPANSEAGSSQLMSSDTTGPGKVTATENSAPEQVLFHLSSSDDDTARELLDQVELVASHFASRARELRIIVIANNEGLRVFQAGLSSQAERIRRLYTRYDNIVFAACGATLERFQNAGEHTELLPQVIVIDSGVAEITRRQLVGWKYIRI